MKDLYRSEIIHVFSASIYNNLSCRCNEACWPLVWKDCIYLDLLYWCMPSMVINIYI